jgi:Fe-Mn family superoxide dismutase
MPTYTLPELPYDVAALEKLSEARAKEDFAAINQLQKSLAFNLSGHVLHSLFWKNLSPKGGGEPQGELGAMIQEYFGSFAGMKQQLTEAATNIQGSGWGALAWEPLGKQLVVEQVYDHQGNIGTGTVPLLVLDMWEHAYYLQYKNVKADWVTAYWKIVNWEDVAKRLRAVKPLDLAL